MLLDGVVACELVTVGWLQGDLNLNIAEAHAFNTTDRFSLDVFVVTGWTGQVCPARLPHRTACMYGLDWTEQFEASDPSC